MALTLGDNFSYQGAKPLDARLNYTDLATMKAVADATMYEGCMGYCVATGKTYQWKSTNTVDESTGKWREFSSGGGGGGSYTAGDGIDITNDVISTEKSQQGDIDEIVDVYPTAGNLVSIVNAFNRGDIYSTDEKMIGQWTNGKPLYQKYCTKTVTRIDESLNGSNDHPRTIYTKTYTASMAVILRNITAYTDTSRNEGYIVIKKNSEQLLKMYIISDKDTPYDGEVSVSVASGDVLTVEGDWDNSHSSIKWKFSADNLEYDIDDAELFFEKVPNVLNYTKTTDTAISMGEATEYSTTEKVVGTWINGKPIYQKTVIIENPATDWDTLNSYGISNIENIVSVNSRYSMDNDAWEGSEWEYSSNYLRSIFLKDSFRLSVQGATVSKAILTLQYTKSTT